MMDSKFLKKRKLPGRGVSMTPAKLAVGVAVLVVVVSVILQPSDARSVAEDEKSLLDLMAGNKEGAVSTGENHGDHDVDGPRVDHEEPERVLKRVKRCGGWRICCRRVCKRYCYRSTGWFWSRRRRSYCCEWGVRCGVH